MTAMACLRVAVEADRTGLPEATLGPLVEKLSSAYLETRWLWPRRFAPLTHYCFLLTDPRADDLDTQELDRMSEELQVKLFGEVEAGEVDLLLFEGPPEALTAFAAMDTEAVLRALSDAALLPPGGRLTRIEAAEAPADADRRPPSAETPAAEEGGPEWVEQRVEAAADAPPAAPPRMPQLEGVQGVYFIPRGLFIGDVISSTPGHARTHFSLVEGEPHMPADPAVFDADCLVAAARYFSEGAVQATLYVPVCYSNLVRASQRGQYEAMFALLLPKAAKPLLAAAVYDVPRAPGFGALSQVVRTLRKHFSHIDLRTRDPGFEVEKLARQAVTSVTFVLPEGEQRVRLAALRRFADRLPLYKDRQIWATVTNVRNRTELEACAAAKAPFVTGPGVCRLQTRPMGGRIRELDRLPVLAE